MRVASRAFAIAAIPALLVFVILPLSGCAANWRALWPGGVTAADEEWAGVKSGEVVSIIGMVDPRAAAASAVLEGLGAQDPFGVLMPLTMVGEKLPRWVKCVDEFTKRCRDYPLQTRVHFAGTLEGNGPLWVPKRLRGDGFPD